MHWQAALSYLAFVSVISGIVIMVLGGASLIDLGEFGLTARLRARRTVRWGLNLVIVGAVVGFFTILVFP